jgi:PAS domain S-box-containing protein
LEINELGKKLIPNAIVNSLIVKLFKGDTAQKINNQFTEARMYGKIAESEICLTNAEDTQLKYSIIISPFKSNSHIYYLFSFHSLGKADRERVIKKVVIHTSEIEKIISNKNILAIIENIKFSFPFTFIERTKIQNEVDKLDEFFWIKNTNGNLILVNQNYAEYMGVNKTQIEGKKESGYLPGFLSSTFKNIDKLIVDTSNSIMIDSIKNLSPYHKNELVELIEFPICDMDDNVIAIVGLTQIKSITESDHNLNIMNQILGKISSPILILDMNLRLVHYNNQFIKFFKLPEELEQDSFEVKNFLDQDFITQLIAYSNENTKLEEFHDNIKIIESLGDEKIVNVEISKIMNVSESDHNILLIFNASKKEEESDEIKSDVFNALLYKNPEPIFIYNSENLKFLESNEAALKLYGYDKAEFLKLDLTDLYAPEDIQTLIQSSSIQKEEVFTGPWKHKKKDGTSVLVEMGKSNIEFEGKNANLIILRNVTKSVEINKMLQSYKASFDNTDDIIIMTDNNGFLTYANQHAPNVFGYSEHDFSKRPFLSLVADVDRAKVNSNIFHSGIKSTQSINIEIKKMDGSLQNAELTATPVIDYSGEIESFNLILKLEAENFPQSINEEASEIEKVVKPIESDVDARFLSNIFHELLTPLNVMTGFIQEITESIEDPTNEQIESTEIIKENQNVLLKIMDDAVEYLEHTKGKVDLAYEQVKFIDLIDIFKQETKELSESNGVGFSYGKISNSLKFVTDKQRFLNLVSQFLKFAIRITDENRIFISAYQYDKNHFILSVKDNAVNITEKLLINLNDIFVQDESILRKNYNVSTFTIKLIKKTVETLSARIETIVKAGKPTELGIVFPLNLLKETTKTESIEKEEDLDEQVQKLEKPIVEDYDLELGETDGKSEVFKDRIIQKDSKSFESEPEKQAVDKEISFSQDEFMDLSHLSCLYLEDQVDSQIPRYSGNCCYCLCFTG